MEKQKPSVDKYGLPEPCASCPGACCGFSNEVQPIIEFTDQEAEFIRQAGTVLEELAAPLTRGLPTEEAILLAKVVVARRYKNNRYSTTTPNHGSYRLLSPCGYGRKTPNGSVICMAVNNPKRPGACHRFNANGPACNDMQEAAKNN